MKERRNTIIYVPRRVQPIYSAARCEPGLREPSLLLASVFRLLAVRRTLGVGSISDSLSLSLTVWYF